MEVCCLFQYPRPHRHALSPPPPPHRGEVGGEVEEPALRARGGPGGRSGRGAPGAAGRPRGVGRAAARARELRRRAFFSEKARAALRPRDAPRASFLGEEWDPGPEGEGPEGQALRGPQAGTPCSRVRPGPSVNPAHPLPQASCPPARGPAW